MSIDKLKMLVPPPIKRQWLLTEKDWLKLCHRLNTNLPDDYKELVLEYGPGCFADFLWLHDPFTKNKHLNVIDQLETCLSTLRELRDGETEVIPYPLFPSPGGLFPCATTDNGDVIYWLTTGIPNDWTIAVNAARDDRWEDFDICLSDFLYNVLRGDLKVSIFPSDFPPAKIEYRPWIE